MQKQEEAQPAEQDKNRHADPREKHPARDAIKGCHGLVDSRDRDLPIDGSADDGIEPAFPGPRPQARRQSFPDSAGRLGEKTVST